MRRVRASLAVTALALGAALTLAGCTGGSAPGPGVQTADGASASPASPSTTGDAGPRGIPAGTKFYAPAPSATTTQSIARLASTGGAAQSAAKKLHAMVTTPHAVWLNGGSQSEVYHQVFGTVQAAAKAGRMPVFVAYDVPGRDCGDYSAGGAAGTTSYLGWIGSLASALGSAHAIVILEPDSLANLPSACRNHKLSVSDSDRFAAISGAITRLEKQPHVAVYLDSGNSTWLNAATAADRLVQAGVARAQGFFLNVSNFVATAANVTYGQQVAALVAQRIGGPAPHFIVDTSRNGASGTDYGRYTQAPYGQPGSVVQTLEQGRWCNPPGARLGTSPTAQPGPALVDAYLWVKTPGTSDGQCDTAGGARAWNWSAYSPKSWPTDAAGRSSFDPLWGVKDPPAGAWFQQAALTLVGAS